MKKYLPYIIGFILSALIIGGGFFYQKTLNVGATISYPQYGGTGKGSATAGDVGKYLKVSDDSPFTYSFDTPSGGTGTTINQLGQVGDVSTSSPMTYGLMLRFNTATSKWESVATSTLGISNTYTNFGTDFYTYFHATTTDYLTQGSTNKYLGALSVTVTGLTFSSPTLSLTTGYVIASTTRANQWDTAYSWGDWSGQGFITGAQVPANETDSAHDTCAEITGCVQNALTGVTADSPLSGSGTSGSHLIFTNPGYITGISGLTLNDLGDVATTSTFYGDLLMWNGTNWTNNATSTLGLALSESDPVWLSEKGSYLLTANAFTQAQASTTFVARNDWTTIDNYPNGCSAGQYISALGDTSTCGTPTNTTYTATYPITLTGTAFGIIATSSMAINTSDLINNSNWITNAQETDAAHDNCSEITGCVVGAITGNQSITLSGDVSGTGATAITTAIGADKVNDLMIDWGTTGNQVSTADVTEQTNLYYTDTRVNAYIHASSTIPKTYTSNTWGGTQTFTNAPVFTSLGTAAGTFLAVNATGLVIATTTPSGGGWDNLLDISLTKGNFIVGNDEGTAQATSTIFISSTGKVGIGTTTPNNLLQVYDLIDIDNVGFTTKIGYQAGKYFTKDPEQAGTFIGYQAGSGLSYTGSGSAKNTGVGYRALYKNDSNTYTVAIGAYSMENAISGDENTAVGSYSLRANSGSYNVAYGIYSMEKNVGGGTNSAFGAISLNKNVSGNYNVALGSQSLLNVLGSNNVGIGYYAGAYETGSNAFYVDNQNRTNTAGDKANALFYGTFAAAAANQSLTINAHLNVTGTSTFSDLLSATNATTTLLTVSSAIFLPDNSVEETDINFTTSCNSSSKLYIDSGNLACNADQSASGAGVGTVSTSTTPVIGNLAYWTGIGWPSTLGTVGTSTLTGTYPISISNSPIIIGASGAVVTFPATSTLFGTGTAGQVLSWSGSAPIWAATSTNANTATALVANGSNCTSGQAPLGVDASGAVESCFDVWTEAENTSAAYTTVAGAMTGTYDGNNFAGGAIGAGELLYGASAGSIAELAAGTSGYVLMSAGTAAPLWVSTSTFILSTEIDTFAELDAIVADGDLAVLSSAMTGTFDGVDFGNGTLAQNAIWVGGAAAIPSELALGTGGTILASSGGTLAYIATTTIPLGGDVTGTLSVSVVGDDSHNHTASTISGLGTADFTSANISQWTNDSLYISSSTLSSAKIFVGNSSNKAAVVDMSGDITISNTGATTIGADKVLESMLKAVDAGLDEECLTFETTTGDFEWQSCGGGSQTPWISDINGGGYNLTNVGIASSTNFLANMGTTAAYSFTGDTDTGMRDGSPNVLVFMAGDISYLDISTAGVRSLNSARFLAANGTAASPGLVFANDTTSGLFAPILGGNTLGISTNGVERLRINSSGDIAIGTTTPYSKLTVWGSNANMFEIANNASTTLFRVNSSGNVYTDGSSLSIGYGQNISNTYTLAMETGSMTYSAANGFNFSTAIGGLTVGQADLNITCGGGTTICNGTTIGTYGLKLFNTDDTQYIRLLSTSTPASFDLYLPSDDGMPAQALLTNGSGILYWGTPASGAGGSDTQVQFNSFGALVGDSTFTYASSTDKLTVSYASSTAITVTGNSYLGTISSGTWNATAITTIYGGTGFGAGGLKSTFIPFGNGTNAFATSSALYFTTGTSNLTYSYGSTTALTVSGTAYLTTVMGAVDLGGATSLELPQDGTIDTTGEVKWDTTSGTLQIYNGSAVQTFKPFVTLVGNVASSTWGTGTTTVYLGPAVAAGTITEARCEISAGTLGVSLYDGTNRANYIKTASTTIDTFTYTTNNTFTANESIRMDVGTAVSSPTQITCRFKFVYTAD
jgi:hypothetical protein